MNHLVGCNLNSGICEKKIPGCNNMFPPSLQSLRLEENPRFFYFRNLFSSEQRKAGGGIIILSMNQVVKKKQRYHSFYKEKVLGETVKSEVVINL